MLREERIDAGGIHRKRFAAACKSSMHNVVGGLILARYLSLARDGALELAIDVVMLVASYRNTKESESFELMSPGSIRILPRAPAILARCLVLWRGRCLPWPLIR